jgi:hypothetical protein
MKEFVLKIVLIKVETIMLILITFVKCVILIVLPAFLGQTVALAAEEDILMPRI